MQAATSLPTFLLGLPAGALADMVDRRRLLFLSQAWMLVAAFTLAGLTLAGLVTPAILLGLTFAIGLGVAMTGPAWQATAPRLVPPEDLPAAVALNGVAVNLGRAVGPAAGGLLLSAAGAGTVFLANGASFIGLLTVVARWRPETAERSLPPERLSGAMRAGIRFLRHSPELQAVMVRTGLFVLGASALFGLLPVIARRQLGLGSAGFGLLLALVGIGAIGGAAVLPRIRRRAPLDVLVLAATLVLAGAIAVLALVHVAAAAYIAMLFAGLAWISLMASLNVAAQRTAPGWVRARALAVYLLMFQGGLAIGSAVWGEVADLTSVRTSLLGAAAFLVAGLATLPRWRLGRSEDPDLRPFQWPEPLVEVDPGHDRGPVMVTVEYLIDPARGEEFATAMEPFGRIRRRDGAYRWGLYADVAKPGRYVEVFLVESWLEHLRQHVRGTHADRALQERVRAFHIGVDPPLVSHLISERRLVPRVGPR
jgi:predicted MFS family arabinose efflux permease